MNHFVSGPVSRGQWSEEETDEEEEVSPESGPQKEYETDGSLQINLDEEEPFVLPPAGEMEQDILPVKGEGSGKVLLEGLSRPWAIMKQLLNRPTCPGSRLATNSQAHPRHSGSAA